MYLALHFVTGGAEVTLRSNDRPIYDGLFVPELFPQDYQLSAGGNAQLTDLQSHWSGPALSPSPAPLHLTAIDHALNDKAHHTSTHTVTFPASTEHIGRVVATLRLDKTPNGIDPWDRVAHIYLLNDDGTRTELLRYITPYRRAWEWKQDVTDLLPLLTGTRTLEVACETYGPGWLVSLDFDFYPGDLSPRPVRVTTLWDKTVLIGQADKPIHTQLPPTTLPISPGTTAYRLRTLVTGHGGEPNANNAGEFFPLWRTITVGESSYSNRLWKTDNYLNPCRPQGGTWKYDRAGWGPGTLVEPWTIDITRDVLEHHNPTVSYDIEPYDNPTPDKGYPAQHKVTVQLIEYK
jgi:hypothetical protein